MMDQAAEMARIFQLRFDLQLVHMRKLTQKENEIRKQLKRLQDYGRQTKGAPATALAQRLLGADVLWQSWLGRNKSRLNTELAGILAQKADVQVALADAFGRMQVADQISDRMQAARKARQVKRRHEVLQRLSLHR